MALDIRYYHENYCDVPQGKLLGVLCVEALTDESKRLLVHGLQNLVSALAEVMGVAAAGAEEADRST